MSGKDKNTNNQQLLSNNAIASNNDGISVFKGSKLTFFKDFLRKTNNYFYTFVNQLPPETTDKVSSAKDHDVIYELFKNASLSEKHHEELKILLNQYLNSECEIEKLYIHQSIEDLKLINKKLINILYLVSLVGNFSNKDYFLQKLPNKIKEYFNLIQSISNEDVYYLLNLGFLKDISGNLNIDYNPLSKRIAYFVWSYLNINDATERKQLEQQILEHYEADNDFKILCNFIYEYNLHKLVLTPKGSRLSNLYYNNNINIYKEKLIKISDLKSL